MTLAIATYLDIILAAFAIIGLVYGFYKGFVPRWLKKVIGYYDLKDDIHEIKTDTNQLKQDHTETMDEIENLKTGQIAVAEVVGDQHNGLKVEGLRSLHGRSDDADEFLTKSDDD